MSPILKIILITFLPFLELRASIPYGIFNTNLSILSVFILAVVSNIILAPILYFFLNYLIHFFLKIRFIDRIYQKTITKTQQKVHLYVEKYGIIGLAIFIGVPLPGSGVYSAALGAYVLGFKFKDLFIASVIGVLIAGIIVLLVSTIGNGALQFLIKKV